MGIANLGIAQTIEETLAEVDEALENRNCKKALKKITYVIENTELKEEYIHKKAIAEGCLGKFQEAYDTYSDGILKLPKSAILYDCRGTLLYELKDFEYAIEDYNIAIQLETEDSIKYAYLNNRAAAKMSIRDFEGAYDDLIQAYNIDSTKLGTLTNLGVVCDEVNRGDETLKYLLKAVEIDPDFYPAYANIGFKYQFMGEHKKAIYYYDKVLEFNPEEPLGYSNRAYSRMKLGDLKGALKDVNKSLDLFPANAYAYRNRALIYIEMGKIKKACENLDAAIERDFTKMYGNEVAELLAKYCE